LKNENGFEKNRIKDINGNKKSKPVFIEELQQIFDPKNKL
jgi:hypothetical protein